MKEYILNIEFGNWQNQLWFMNKDTEDIQEKWQTAIKEVNSIKESSKEPIEFQDKVIDYLKGLGFIRIQK